jgi:hypothetical protein
MKMYKVSHTWNYILEKISFLWENYKKFLHTKAQYSIRYKKFKAQAKKQYNISHNWFKIKLSALTLDFTQNMIILL